MNETNPRNHNWSHFMILSGLTLHQFQKKNAVKGAELTQSHFKTIYLPKQQQYRKLSQNSINQFFHQLDHLKLIF